MKQTSIPVFILIILLTACASQPTTPTVIADASTSVVISTLTPPALPPTEQAPTETPAPTATLPPTDTATAIPTETIVPFDLESKTCTPDDGPAILAAVQEKFHFSADTPNGTLITNNETSPTYSGPMEIAFQCTLTGTMKDPSGKEGDVSVDGLHLVVFHIKAGEDAFLQLIYDDRIMKDVLSGNKLRTGRPGIADIIPTENDKRAYAPNFIDLEILEQYNNLGSILAQIKQGSLLPNNIQSQAFAGVFFNP